MKKPLHVFTTSGVEVQIDGILDTQHSQSYVVGPLTIFPMHSLQYMVPQEQNVLHIITSLYLQLAWGMKTQNVATEDTLIPCYCGFQSWQASVSVNKQPNSP